VTTLRREIEEAINRHGRENRSGTPDFILASYLMDCLQIFERATNARDQWWNHEPKIGGQIDAKDVG